MPVWMGGENLAPTGIQSPDRPARRQSLYQLSYPAHRYSYIMLQLRARRGLVVCASPCSHKRHKEVEYLGCHVRSFCGMEIHHDCHEQNCLAKYGFSTVWYMPAMMTKTASGWNLKIISIAPIFSAGFFMSTILSLPPVINQQVWTAQAPCMRT